jgi:hypothetical protein
MITTLCFALSIQRKAMENCVELLIAKLLHATKDGALKVIHLQCLVQLAFADATNQP